MPLEIFSPLNFFFCIRIIFKEIICLQESKLLSKAVFCLSEKNFVLSSEKFVSYTQPLCRERSQSDGWASEIPQLSGTLLPLHTSSASSSGSDKFLKSPSKTSLFFFLKLFSFSSAGLLQVCSTTFRISTATQRLLPLNRYTLVFLSPPSLLLL